jgi:ribosomal protein S27AE
MDIIASVLMILAVLVLVALFVLRPFLSAKPVVNKVESDPFEHKRSALLAERDRLLTALQELEFDQVLGKIPTEDYPAQRAELLKSGSEIYRKLDEMDQSDPAASAEDRLEAAVAARRADATGQRQPVQGAGRVVQPTSSAYPAPADELEKSAGFCPGCGNPVQKSDKFCPRCGKTL